MLNWSGPVYKDSISSFRRYAEFTTWGHMMLLLAQKSTAKGTDIDQKRKITKFDKIIII